MSISVLNKLHRWVGFGAAIIVVMLCITGIALNHTAELQLAKQPIPNWIAKPVYGAVIVEQQAFSVKGQTLSATAAGELTANHRAISHCGTLTGVMELQNYLLAACSGKLLVLDEQARLLEEMHLDSLDIGVVSRVYRYGPPGSVVYLEGEIQALELDPDTMQTRPAPSFASPEPSIHSVAVGYTQPSVELSYERLFLDLHAGRVVGGWGVWLVDLTAISLLLLIITGFLAWRAKLKLLRED